MAKPTKKDFLKKTIQHIDIKKYNVVPMVEAFENMAYASREVARASKIYNMMLSDKKCRRENNRLWKIKNNSS